MQSSSKSLAVYVTFLCLFSGAAYALILHSHHETAPLSRLIMWRPGAAAIATCLLLRVPLACLSWQWPTRGWLSLSYVLPLLYATPVYVLTWAAIRGAFALKPFETGMAAQYGVANWPVLGAFGVGVPLLFTITVIGTVTWALGEEIGWRGLMFPALLERFGFHGAALITGLVWAVWHYPGLIWADYNAGTDARFAITCFTVMVIAMSYLSCYLRLRSGSIWPSVLLHAAHNTFIQGIFDPLTAATGKTKYITSEFGLGLAITIIVTAYVVIAADHSRRDARLVKLR